MIARPLHGHLKLLREFLCDRAAPEVVHDALDRVMHHVRMLPEERAKRDLVPGDWVRVAGAPPVTLAGVVAQVQGFREGCRLSLSGLTGSFEGHQLEHWFPQQEEEIWVPSESMKATVSAPMARGSDTVEVLDGRNDRLWYDLSEIEPYVGQDGQ